MFYPILSLCLLGSALAQVPSYGACPEVQTDRNFKLSPYMGKWYEARRYFSLAEITAKCVTAHYDLQFKNQVKMETTEISTATGKFYKVESIARIPDWKDPAKLKVKFAKDPFGFEADYFVLGTDYKSYAVVYNCYNVKSAHVKHAWILTRERNPPQSVIDQAIAVAQKNHLHKFMFLKSNQSGC